MTDRPVSILSNHSIADLAVQENPFDFYDALQEIPLHFDEQAGFFITGKYAVVREIVRDTARFSNVESQTMDGMRPPPEEVLEIRKSMVPGANTLVTNDPPGHTRIRDMLDNPFALSHIESSTEAIRQVCEDAVDAFIDKGCCEFISDYAVTVPLQVIADQLGLPRAMASKLKDWSDAAVEPLGMMISDERLIACTRLTREFQDYFLAELDERKAKPRDDLLTRITQARDPQGQGFSVAEQLSLCSQLLVAGNETTTNALGHGMQYLVERPDVFQALRENPEHSQQFTEEVLRLASPAQGLFRVVTEDVEIDGVKLPKGSRVMLRWAAANRDPDRFECPHELDLERRNAMTHIAFGAGIHRCLGANLAKAELIQTFALLPGKLHNLRFADGKNDFSHHPNMLLRGLKELHLEFDKG